MVNRYYVWTVAGTLEQDLEERREECNIRGELSQLLQPVLSTVTNTSAIT